MTYAAQHDRALDQVRRKGAALTFTKSTRTLDDETGEASVSTATVAGQAVRVPGDPKRYGDLGLLESQAPTLLFVPTTLGEEPELGATCAWGGETFTVADVEPLAPDGSTILARVVVKR